MQPIDLDQLANVTGGTIQPMPNPGFDNGRKAGEALGRKIGFSDAWTRRLGSVGSAIGGAWYHASQPPIY